MPLEAGTYTMGPDNASLAVKTGRTGVAAKAGHDLIIDVTAWGAVLRVGGDPTETRIELSAESDSLRVREGVGGIQALGDEDKASIQQTIADEVLKGDPITFRSTEVRHSTDGDALSVRGELELAGESHPIGFELNIDGQNELRGAATVKQSDWGLKPYSTLFGTLKVLDEVEVVLEAGAPTRRPPAG